MLKIKKALRVCLFIILLVLAIFGVGIVGGVPINILALRDQKSETNIEMVEQERGDTNVKKKEVK